MTGEFSAWHPILFHLIQIVDISEIGIKEIRKGSAILILYYDKGQNCLLAIYLTPCSRPRGSGFEPHQCHCVVSLRKTH